MDLKAPAWELAGMIRDGRVTAEEVLRRTMEEVERTADLNMFISTNPNAVAAAREVDRHIRDGAVPGRLAGVPISIKDNICTRNLPTTCASKMLEGYVPPYDATPVRRLLEEGAIIVGKTNMDEFGMGLSTEFSAYGRTKNPVDPEMVPGGSTGGGAASVATGTSAISLGSDTGGSIRNPASFCGVVGFKPTYGMVSRYGLVSYANSIEQVGPLARTIRDAELALGMIAGTDPNDNTTTIPHSTEPRGDHNTIEGHKVGVLRQMVRDTADPGILAALDGAVHRLESAGAACVDVSLETAKYSVAAYYTITSVEAASNLARYDNVRYGYELDQGGYEFHRYVTQARDRFGPEVKRRIIAGGFAASSGHAGRYYRKALKVKGRLTREISALFRECRYLVSPTVPVPPFRAGDKIDDPVELFQIDANTVTANLTGRPAVSVPFGSSQGLPVGIQVMADSGQDMALLRAARHLEGQK